jgi:hypothetical protein
MMFQQQQKDEAEELQQEYHHHRLHVQADSCTPILTVFWTLQLPK